MLKQFFINRYFHKLCTEKFLKNDDEEIIGKAKDVIQNIKEQIEYIKNPENSIDDETIESIVYEANWLIKEINKTYFSKNDVIRVHIHPMTGFYVLQDKETVLDILKQYYKERNE